MRYTLPKVHHKFWQGVYSRKNCHLWYILPHSTLAHTPRVTQREPHNFDLLKGYTLCKRCTINKRFMICNIFNLRAENGNVMNLVVGPFVDHQTNTFRSLLLMKSWTIRTREELFLQLFWRYFGIFKDISCQRTIDLLQRLVFYHDSLRYLKNLNSPALNKNNSF